MAIATELEVTWNGTVDATNKIGLSKPFAELASDVWADDSAFITAYNNPAAKFTKVSDGYPTCPVKSDNCPWYLTGGIGYSNINHNSDSIYLRSAIICIPDNFVYNTWNGNQGGRIRDNINNFRIVTSMSTLKNGVDVALTVQDGTVVGAQYILKETLAGSSSNGGITIGAGTYVLMIVDIYTVEGNYYLNIPYSLPGFVYDTNNGDGVMGMWAYDSSVNKMFSLSPQIFPTDDGRISITGGAVYNVNTWNRHELPAVEGDANLIFCASYIPWNWYLSLSGNVHYHLLAVSRFGLKFKYNNENYKPIISQGVVTGYTTDMAVPSDIDNWTDISGHNISPTPPPPVPPGPGYDDDPWSGVSFSGVGVGGAGAFARCYYMTTTELANLRTWMSGVGVPEGFNPMAQIIGLSQVPVALSGDAPETVQFINSSAVYDPGVVSRVVDSGVSTQYSMGKPISYSLGSIDISRRMQERGEPYLDYSCQIELYLPLIGTFSLDTQAVMGRTLEAEAILDPISGTLAAYAWVSRDGEKLPVAYGSTTIGIDLPITAQQYSMSRAAAKQINAQFTASMLSSALTTVTAAAAAGSASSAAAGRAGAASGAGIQPASQFNSYAQSASIAGSQTAISQSGNIFGAFMEWGRAVRQLSYGNNTAIAGSFGGSMAQWSYPFDAYVKIIRPRYEKPSNYNHTQGVPCVQTKKIGRCTGLIQCIGADVSGITRATDIERQAIQAALSNGVYAGGGE